VWRNPLALAVTLPALIVIIIGSTIAGAEETHKHTPTVKVIRDPALGDDAVARMENVIGQSIFERIWVSAPSSTEAADGLGPMFNARSCVACHPGGARGSVLNKDGSLGPSLLVRFGHKLTGAPDPIYGNQLQTDAARGVPAEGKFSVDYALLETKLGDGTVVELRRPVVTLTGLADGPLAADTVTGLRLAPAIHGMGPLDSIPAELITAAADPDDQDANGISGRVNWIDEQAGTFGRFGWKAVQPTMEAQNAHAFLADMGLSTPLFPDAYGECTVRQTICRAAPSGASSQFEDLEVSSTLMKVLDRYVGESVLPNGPAQSASAETIAKGRALFAEAGCGSCHKTSYDIVWPAGAAKTRHIAPYTDLMLHDMGDGLAEQVIEGEALGAEWRTAPLWGLRWAVAGEGDASLLHDGRARNLLEAILWHGGEALSARDQVAALSADDRQALISFLSSL
jgi:CxxC motif-containing protein (DUF1111 family)